MTLISICCPGCCRSNKLRVLPEMCHLTQKSRFTARKESGVRRQESEDTRLRQGFRLRYNFGETSRRGKEGIGHRVRNQGSGIRGHPPSPRLGAARRAALRQAQGKQTAGRRQQTGGWRTERNQKSAAFAKASAFVITSARQVGAAWGIGHRAEGKK